MAKTLTIGPATLNIVLRKGATFNKVFTYKTEDPDTGVRTPVNLTGFTARMQVRLTPTTGGSPLVSLTTENGGITLGGTAGTITPLITAVDSAAYTFEEGTYDLELVSAGGIVTSLFGGKFTLTDETTR